MAPYDDIGGAPAIRAALDALYPRVRGSSRWRSVAPTPIRNATFRTRTPERDSGVRTTRYSIVPDMSPYDE